MPMQPLSMVTIMNTLPRNKLPTEAMPAVVAAAAKVVEVERPLVLRLGFLVQQKKPHPMAAMAVTAVAAVAAAMVVLVVTAAVRHLAFITTAVLP